MSLSPRPHASRRKAQGFTLIELMVTVAIMAFLLAAVVPNLMSTIQSRQTDSVMSRFAQDMAWARSQALSGQTVEVTMPAKETGASACSWGVYENGSSTSVPAHSLLDVAMVAPGMTCANTTLDLSFDSTGLVSNLTGDSTIVFQAPGGKSHALRLFASGLLVEDSSYAD